MYTGRLKQIITNRRSLTQTNMASTNAWSAYNNCPPNANDVRAVFSV